MPVFQIKSLLSVFTDSKLFFRLCSYFVLFCIAKYSMLQIYTFRLPR